MTYLDTYTGAAAGYSLRKLRSAYIGSAIRVRRSSDSTEQDIGFDGNTLDTAALLTFCGAGSGFITTWYDQSGNANNAVQATASLQYRIVNAGVLDVDAGSRPQAISVASGSFYLSGPMNGAVEPSEFTCLGVGTPVTNSATTSRFYGIGDNVTDTCVVCPDGTLRFFGASLTTLTTSTDRQMRIVTRNGTLYTDWRNFVAGTSGSTAEVVLDQAIIGNSSNNSGQKFQELVFWLSDMVADRDLVGVASNRYWETFVHPYNLSLVSWSLP